MITLKIQLKKMMKTLCLPRLNKTDHDILHSKLFPFYFIYITILSFLVLKLHQLNDKSTSNKSEHVANPYLQIPISIGYDISFKPTFDDSTCNSNKSLLTNDDQTEQENLINHLNKKSSHHHIIFINILDVNMNELLC